jgi:hypothetical protein
MVDLLCRVMKKVVHEEIKLKSQISTQNNFLITASQAPKVPGAPTHFLGN